MTAWKSKARSGTAVQNAQIGTDLAHRSWKCENRSVLPPRHLKSHSSGDWLAAGTGMTQIENHPPPIPEMQPLGDPPPAPRPMAMRGTIDETSRTQHLRKSSSIGDGNRCFEERTTTPVHLQNIDFRCVHQGNQASVTFSLHRWKEDVCRNPHQKPLAKPTLDHQPHS